MDKQKNDFGAQGWPFPWDPYLELREDAPPATAQDPTPTTKRSSLPPPAMSSATEVPFELVTRARTASARAAGPSSATRRRQLTSRWEAIYEPAPPTHLGVEPQARAATGRTVAWVVTLAAAVGLLVWLTLKLPSFAIEETHLRTNQAIMAKSHAALVNRGVQPPSAATDLASAPPPTTEPAAPPTEAARKAGTKVATKDQAGPTTTVKETKSSARRASQKPSSPSRAPAPRPVMASNPDSVYPDPAPAPAPVTQAAQAAEGEIFNRPPSPN